MKVSDARLDVGKKQRNATFRRERGSLNFVSSVGRYPTLCHAHVLSSFSLQRRLRQSESTARKSPGPCESADHCVGGLGWGPRFCISKNLEGAAMLLHHGQGLTRVTKWSATPGTFTALLAPPLSLPLGLRRGGVLSSKRQKGEPEEVVNRLLLPQGP